MRKVLAWIVVALLIVVPLGGVGVFSWVQAQDPETLAPKPVAVLQQPTAVSDDGETDATITATLKAGLTVTAPAWQGGVVTRVDVTPGAPVSTGMPLLAIDGVTRIAAATPSPFYRALAVGDKGEDVKSLESALGAMGLFRGTANQAYDEATAGAVKKLEKRIGVPGEPTGAFDPLWMVWLPAEGLEAQTVNAAVNQAAPAQGTPIFSTAPSVENIAIAGKTGSLDFQSGAYILGQSGADVATIRSESDVNLDLIGKLTAQDESGSAGGSGAPAASRTYAVSLRRETAVTLLSVPSSAVMTGRDGSVTCVYGKNGPEDATYRAMQVTVVGGSLGVTHLEPTDGLQDFYVLADPLAVMQETPSCR